MPAPGQAQMVASGHRWASWGVYTQCSGLLLGHTMCVTLPGMEAMRCWASWVIEMGEMTWGAWG